LNELFNLQQCKIEAFYNRQFENLLISQVDTVDKQELIEKIGTSRFIENILNSNIKALPETGWYNYKFYINCIKIFSFKACPKMG